MMMMMMMMMMTLTLRSIDLTVIHKKNIRHCDISFLSIPNQHQVSINTGQHIGPQGLSESFHDLLIGRHSCCSQFAVLGFTTNQLSVHGTLHTLHAFACFCMLLHHLEPHHVAEKAHKLPSTPHQHSA